MKKYNLHLGSAESQKPQSSQRRASPARLRRSGSLNLDPDIFKSTNFSDLDVGKESLAKTVLLILTKVHPFLKFLHTTAKRSSRKGQRTFKWKRISFSCFLFHSGTQSTHALKEPQCWAHIFPPLEPPHIWLLPTALLSTGYTPRRHAHSDTVPPSCWLIPLYVQHLAQQKREQPSPARHQPLERDNRHSKG